MEVSLAICFSLVHSFLHYLPTVLEDNLLALTIKLKLKTSLYLALFLQGAFTTGSCIYRKLILIYTASVNNRIMIKAKE